LSNGLKRVPSVRKKLRKSASWRGSPTATTKKEFTALLNSIKLSKEQDVFYDLGCGYGKVCIWAAPKVKFSIGYENHHDRFRVALREVKKSGFKNITIRNRDFFLASYKRATFIYSMVDIGLHVMSRINRQSRPGTRVVQYRRPNYPLKAKWISGNYFLMKTPFERTKNADDFATNLIGRKRATVDDLFKYLGREEGKYLKKEIRDSDTLWNELFLKRS
jgi:SAM-dependent methyltransferase